MKKLKTVFTTFVNSQIKRYICRNGQNMFIKAEKDTIKRLPTHPGDVLKEELECRKISQKRFSELLGIPYTMLNEILNGKRSVTSDLYNMKSQPTNIKYLSVFRRALICSLLLSVFILAGCNNPPKNLFENGGNIGDVLFPGALVFDPNTNTYRLSGGGTNMWGTSDEFFMIWKEVKGDFSFSAKVAFEGEGVDPHRKMGLIIRKSLETDAVYADVAVHGDGLTSLQYRTEKGAETQEVVSENVAPGYITLQRKGNRITMKTGMEGFSDEIDGGVTLELPDKCYVGLFICSHNPTVMETGYFSEVTLK